MTIKRKSVVIDMIKNDNNISMKLKESFTNQISQMNEEEFETFLKSMSEAKDKENLQEEMLALQKSEKSGHNDFLRTAAEIFGKITSHESEKQKRDDDLKANEILNKIKSL